MNLKIRISYTALLLLTIVCGINIAFAQVVGDYRSHQSGNWSDVNTWERYTLDTISATSSWVYPAPAFPTSSDSTITITDTTTVVLDTSITVDQTIVNGTLTVIDTNKTLTVANGNGTDLTINGTFNAGKFASNAGSTILVGASGVFNHQLYNTAITAGSGTMTVNGTFKVSGPTLNTQIAFTNITIAASGTLYVASTGIAPRLPASSTGNVVWNTNFPTGKGNTILNTTATTIAGNFTIIATGDTLNLGSGGTLRGLTVSGDMNVQGGIFIISKIPGTKANTLTINGSLNISGGIFQTSNTAKTGGNGVLTVKGNLIQTGGSFGKGTGALGTAVTLSGTVAQQFALQGILNKLAISVNNSAGLVLAGNTVVDTLTLTSGKVVLGNYTITPFVVNNTSATNYFVTNGTGSLRYNVGSSAVSFPIGTTTSYNPVTITNGGTADTFAVRVKSSFDVVPADTTKVVNREWTISETNVGAANASMVFQWNANETGSAFSSGSGVSVGLDKGSGWSTSTAATVSGSGPYTATITGLTLFGNLALANAGGIVTSVESADNRVPSRFALHQNYPNPFNPSTKISFMLSKSGFTTLAVYNILGQKVATLLEQQLSAGEQTVPFDASRLSSGVYFYKLQSGNFNEMKKMVLMK